MRIEPEEVQKFYDDFLQSRLIDYRLNGNLRIEHALKRILPNIVENSNVVDIGCGIGILAEKIGKKAKKGNVWACDISARNIWYANQTVKLDNVSFNQIDVIGEFDQLRELLGYQDVDVIVMVDVIEHLLKEDLSKVFSNLFSILSDEGKIILTYPSPYYQQYLYEQNRDELQIIDEKIELLELVSLVTDVGLTLTHFSLENVWLKNQYVHCILEKLKSVSTLNNNSKKSDLGFVQRAMAALKYRTIVPIRRRKYIDQIFKDQR